MSDNPATAAELVRYEADPWSPGLSPSAGGEWVRFDDVQAALQSRQPADPVAAVPEFTRELAIECGIRVGLISWASEDKAFFTFDRESDVGSKQLVEFAKAMIQASPTPPVQPMGDVARLATRLWNSRDEWACPADIARMLSTPVDPISQAACDVLTERQRQISAEGWTPAHDDGHANGSLSAAASTYALAASDKLNPDQRGVEFGGGRRGPSTWPWSRDWWKPGPPRRMLVKAGALILAEIERLDRAAQSEGGR